MSGVVVPEPEVQAIIALCSHNPMDPGCRACQFRTQAAVEHLTVLAQAAADSLDGKR